MKKSPSLGKVAEATVAKVNKLIKAKTKKSKEPEDQWVSPAARSKAKLSASIVQDKVKIELEPPQMVVIKGSKPKQEERSALMGEIEARVEAASASRMWQRAVYIVKSIKDEDQYFLVMDTAPEQYFTMYRDGAENGIGVFKTDGNAKPRAKVQTVNGEVVKPLRVKSSKTPVILEHKVLKLEDLQTLTQTCIATIAKKEYVVQVRSGWCLMKSLVDQCKDGLIMVIKGQGYYLYPKSMWSEFESIFTSRSYTEGNGYSQSVLPKKFDKYFTKF